MKFLPLLPILFLPALSLAASVVTTNGVVATDVTLGDNAFHRGGTLARVRLHNPTPAPETLRIAFPAQSHNWGDYSQITLSATVPANGTSLVEIPLPVGDTSGDCLRLTDSSGRSTDLHVPGSQYQSWNSRNEIALYATPATKPAVLKELVAASKSESLDYSLSSGFADPWPTDFRAYMPYSACLLTADEFAELPGPSRATLADYAAAGGLLCVFGADTPPDLPLARTADPADDLLGGDIRVVPVGHGAIAAFPAASAETLDGSARSNLVYRLARATNQRLVENARTSLPFHNPLQAHSPDVISVFLLLVAFSVLAGPVLLHRLAKRNRRISILWILPVLSLVVCALLAVVMLLANGVTPEVSRSAIVLLDQAAGRAAVTGRLTILAPHALRKGPSIERDAILVAEGSNDRSGTSRNISLGPTLQLSRGWIRPGIPCALHTRAVHPTHLRLDIAEPADGTVPTVRNLLGAPVRRLYLWNSSGALFAGPSLAPGASSPLVPTPADANEQTLLGDLATDLPKILEPSGDPSPHPRRRFYVAELDGPDSPFLPDPLDGRRARHTARTLVLGSY